MSGMATALSLTGLKCKRKKENTKRLKIFSLVSLMPECHIWSYVEWAMMMMLDFDINTHIYIGSSVDHSDGQFFCAMEWLMFFFRPPSTTMVFQWF